MSPTATPMSRPASDTPARRGHSEPAFPTYEVLQQGERDVSLQEILSENPMLGVTIAQQINFGSVEILDLAIDPSSRRLIDLRLGLRGRTTASLVHERVAVDESGSVVHGNASARAATTHQVTAADVDGGADWTLQMLLRDLRDAHAALDARLESGDDWELLLDDDLALERVGQSRPVLLAWDTTEPVGREKLAAYEGWPRGWMRSLALLTALRRASSRVIQATSHGLYPLGNQVVRTLDAALPVGKHPRWLMSPGPVTH